MRSSHCRTGELCNLQSLCSPVKMHIKATQKCPGGWACHARTVHKQLCNKFSGQEHR